MQVLHSWLLLLRAREVVFGLGLLSVLRRLSSEAGMAKLEGRKKTWLGDATFFFLTRQKYKLDNRVVCQVIPQHSFLPLVVLFHHHGV